MTETATFLFSLLVSVVCVLSLLCIGLVVGVVILAVMFALFIVVSEELSSNYTSTSNKILVVLGVLSFATITIITIFG